jgi:hypothetical protein
VLSFVRKKTLHKKIGYRNDLGLTFVAARLEQKVDALKAFPSFHNEYAGQNAVRFHSQRYRLQSRRRYCACGGFFSAAGEVIGAPSLEGRDLTRLTQAPYKRRLLQAVFVRRPGIC